MGYRRLSMPDVMSIKSVVTILTADLKGRIAREDVHDFWEIVHVKKNDFSVVVDNKTVQLSEGECIIYPPLSVHYAPPGQDSVIQIISFESDSALLSALSAMPIPSSVKIGGMFDEIMELSGVNLVSVNKEQGFTGLVLRDVATQAAIQIIKKKIEILLIEVYSKEINELVGAKRGYKRAYSERLTAYLKSNINKSLTLLDMARELSISVSRLKAISGEILGGSPIDYFITLKMEAATRLISEGSLNFTEISERLGFSSVHYFSKLFKKKLGMTPTEYARTISVE